MRSINVGCLIALVLTGFSHAQTIGLIAHGGALATTGSGTATTAAMNGTGDNFGAACVITYQKDCTTALVYDSVAGSGSPWTIAYGPYSQAASFTTNLCLWIKPNLTVSSSMTLNATMASGFAGIAGAIFSNVKTSSPLDSGATGNPSSGTANGAASVSSGSSLTPSVPGDLGITCVGVQATSVTATLASGTSYATTDVVAPNNPSNTQGVGMAWEVQTTPAAQSPTWDFSGGTGLGGEAALQAFFLLSSGAPKTMPPVVYAHINPAEANASRETNLNRDINHVSEGK
jgi:hypothetical protein